MANKNGTKPRRGSAKKGKAPSSAKSDANKPSDKPKSPSYKTQGIIANIDLIDGAFSIDPIPPYVFEQKMKGISEKSLLFVPTCGDNEDEGVIVDAKIVTGDCMFSTPNGVDLNALIALKNGGVKIEVEVELTGREKEKKLAPQSLKTVKA